MKAVAELGKFQCPNGTVAEIGEFQCPNGAPHDSLGQRPRKRLKIT
jgi:hypothetical protein